MTLKIQDIVIIVAFLLVAGTTYFLAVPQAESLNSKVAELGKLKNDLIVVQNKATSLNNLTTTIAAHKPDIDKLDLALPKDSQASEAMIQIQAMTQRTGVTVTSLSPSQGKAGSLPVTITVKGTYEALSNFAKEMNANLRPVILKTFSYGVGDKKDGGLISATYSTSFEYNGAGEVASPVPGAKASTTTTTANDIPKP